jgi:hypothetical protein
MSFKSRMFRALMPWSSLIVSMSAVAAPEDKVQVQALPTELHHASPLTHYKPYADQVVQPWRASNDRVGQIGGWRAYAKEMADQPASTSPPATNPHAGHHKGEKQ